MRWDRIESEAQRGGAERNRKSQPNTALKQIAFTLHPHPPPRECESESQLVSVSELTTPVRLNFKPRVYEDLPPTKAM
ncbi:GD14798 [Drosophila simulans]|uniref:GD14798 n=1 Tax=Drosophila simulans TaxID=7240 RepID=B4QQF2_DROSI|nr:GD14798 [Drosophila simulans]